MTTETEVNMDELFATGLEADKAAAAEKAMLPPVGNYNTIPPASVSLKAWEEKGTEGEADHKPARLMVNAYAAVAQVGGEQYEGRIGFRFSPNEVKVTRDDGSTDFDRSYKNYVQLHRAYRVAYGTVPESLGDLKKYLETYPVALRVGHVGDADQGFNAVVFNIAAVKG